MLKFQHRSVCDGYRHAEIVEVVDESIISFETILDVLLHMTRHNSKHGNDIGTQYRSCIMPTNEISGKLQSTTMRWKIIDNEIVTTIEEP